MTFSRPMERLFWAGTAAALLVGAVNLRGSTPIGVRSTPAPATGPERLTPMWFATEALDSAIALVQRVDVFRRDRRPVDLAEAPPAPATPVQARPMKPRLVLRGLLGGPPWDAIVEGIPGREGNTVFRLGDPVAGFRVSNVRRDTVIIQGMDTTWRLVLGQP